MIRVIGSVFRRERQLHLLPGHLQRPADGFTFGVNAAGGQWDRLYVMRQGEPELEPPVATLAFVWSQLEFTDIARPVAV